MSKSVFVTGAARGIGLATARRFAREGWRVAIADIDAAAAEAAARELGGHAAAYRLDVRVPAAWSEALSAFAPDGRLDVLVNNAGVARYGWFDEITPEESAQIVAVNLQGVINGVYAALPLLKATPGARLINVASVAGVVGTPKLGVYSATKFAVRGLSDALAIELERYGVGVSCIMPWFIETPLLDQETEATGASIRDMLRGQPVYGADEVAETIWRAVAKGGQRWMVGRQAKVVAALSRFAPGVVAGQL
ncbi:MAG TPA: SDR family oxidoreductase, partial [Caulobacteraceae bacterium]|nr:SDR family oxidoreductase [Caulobacteraceae bacterium]